MLTKYRKTRSLPPDVVQPLDKSYRYIPLTQGQVAIVDAEDFEWLSQWNWLAHWQPNPNTFYVERRVSKGGPRTIRMHREIMKPGLGDQVDHIDRNGLNNTKQNLRICSASQNSANRRHQGRYRGVTNRSNRYLRKPWAAQIVENGRHHHLGHFSTPEEAARAYDKAAVGYFGQFARLNFPGSST